MCQVDKLLVPVIIPEWRLERVFYGLVIPSYDDYDFTFESFRTEYLNPKAYFFSQSWVLVLWGVAKDIRKLEILLQFFVTLSVLIYPCGRSNLHINLVSIPNSGGLGQVIGYLLPSVFFQVVYLIRETHLIINDTIWRHRWELMYFIDSSVIFRSFLLFPESYIPQLEKNTLLGNQNPEIRGLWGGGLVY